MFLKAFLLAAALAIPVTAIQPLVLDSPADAQTQTKKKVKKASKAKVTKGTKAKKVKKAKKAKYKPCPTFHYWKGGKCQDARAKK